MSSTKNNSLILPSQHFKKVMVIYYGGSDWNKKIPFANASTRMSFEDWHVRGLRAGIEFYRASIQWYNRSNHAFKKAWAYREGKWQKIQKKIKPDLIFDKVSGKHDYELFQWKMDIAQHTPMFNSPLFRTIFDNKLSQYIILKDFIPQSFFASTTKEFNQAIKKINSSKVVVKPLYGSGGFGIIIEEKKKILNSKIIYPVLVQEFIKSERGIPNLSKKNEVSDLRIVFMNHIPLYALSRIAKQGSLFTNFHQGATAIPISLKLIPSSITALTAKIQEKIKIFPQAHYSLDFIFDNTGKPFLVEINTTPGFDLLYVIGDEKLKEKNFKEFIKIIP